MSVDGDFAADRATSKWKTGMVQRLGRHLIETTSNLQTSVRLTASECELIALVRGAAHWLGFQAYKRDLGIDLPFDPSNQTVRVRKRLRADEAWAGNDLFKHAACESKTWLQQARSRRDQQPTTSVTS